MSLTRLMRQALEQASPDGSIKGHPNTMHALLYQDLVQNLESDDKHQCVATLTKRGRKERQRLLATQPEVPIVANNVSGGSSTAHPGPS